MRLALLLLASAAWGQTAIRPNQVKLSNATDNSNAVSIAAWDSAGNLTYLDVGPGIRILNGTITATASATPAVPVLLTTRLTRAADGSYPAPTGIVARNGLIQRQGDDYTVAGGVMRPVKPWADDDVILSISAALMVPTGEAKKP